MTDRADLRRAKILVMDIHGTSLLEPTVSALAVAGCGEIHALSGNPRSSARWSHRLKSFSALPATAKSGTEMFQAVLAAAKKSGAQILLPTGIRDIRLMTQHRHQLPPGLACVPVPDAALLDDLADKLRFSRLIGAAGFDVPRTLAVTPGLTADAAAALTFPIAAKPNIGGGGSGCRQLRDRAALEKFLREASALPPYHLQEFVPGDDVLLTMLCEAGEVFAVAVRRRWLDCPGENPFHPVRDMEFIECPWLEEKLEAWVRAVRFSGVADFDARVDFAARRAVFLECDARMMGSQRACAAFGVNMAALLCRRALGEKISRVRARPGRFLSLRSVPSWLRQGGWRRNGSAAPLRTALHTPLADPLPPIARRLGF